MLTAQHPCFNKKACRTSARIHLPIAASCNIQCNFCNRKYDCVNESRPGVTSDVLSPKQALLYLSRMMDHCQNITVVGIAGPGDAFANGDITLETMAMVRKAYPELLLCVSTNGLNLLPYIDSLVAVGVGHVSVTVNAVDPVIGAHIYQWVSGGDNTLLSGIEGASRLLTCQLDAIKLLKQYGVTVKVNSVLVPGINDQHVVDVAKKMASLDVDLFNCMPYLPNDGCVFSSIAEPSAQMVNDVRKKAGQYLTQMLHCRRCRADSVGLLDQPIDAVAIQHLKQCAAL